MHTGDPTPFTPARNDPPPVPPPSPGPNPPPVPLPIPVPLPCPKDSEFPLANGSPNVGRFGLFSTFKSGGPSSEGSIGSFGFSKGFTCGGVNCVILNFGSLPLFTGVSVWSFAPPPPPALVAPVDGSKFVKYSGTNSSANNNTPCAPNAMIWLQPKFSSFDQISFTLTGLIPAGSGAIFVGEKNSRMRSRNPPKFAPQATAKRLFTGPFGTGRELKNSLRFPPTLSPYSVGISGDLKSPRTFTGRSNRNCLRFDQKLSGISIA